MRWIGLLFLFSCTSPPPPAYELKVPPGFPRPFIPPDNPLTKEKVALGRRLFYDKRLSGNGTLACAGCHLQALAFTDGQTAPQGSTGQTHPRNAMSLANVAYASTLTWANPLHVALEQQALVPVFTTSPIVELGVEGREEEVLQRLASDPQTLALFEAAFPGDDTSVSFGNVNKALASFERTMLSGNSPFDRYTYQGDASAMTESALRGQSLFFSERMECFHCHEGFNFTAATRTEKSRVPAQAFFNNGLYNLDASGAYPANNVGLLEVSGDPRDMGRFKPPSLRNVAVTAPYMHDGSIATLEDVVLRHYARGGRLIDAGPHAGDGRQNPFKSGLVRGFALRDDELRDVIAFLESLTDETFLTDPDLADPFH
jgi:cytochrome c peroxidase